MHSGRWLGGFAAGTYTIRTPHFSLYIIVTKSTKSTNLPREAEFCPYLFGVYFHAAHYQEQADILILKK